METLKMWESVYVIVTPTRTGGLDVEMLSERPRFDRRDYREPFKPRAFLANVNGGDSVEVSPYRTDPKE